MFATPLATPPLPRPLIHLASSPSQSAQLFMLELQSVEPKPMKFPGNTWDNAQSAAYTRREKIALFPYFLYMFYRFIYFLLIIFL